VSVDAIRAYIGHFEAMLHQFKRPMQPRADVTSTAADVTSTGADVTSTGADVTSLLFDIKQPSGDV
jgi:hypothetical protein